MNRIAVILLSLCLASSVHNKKPAVKSGTKSTVYVYVCTGDNAYAWHSSKTCRGLNRCSGDIIKITLSEAKERYERPCKICNKK